MNEKNTAESGTPTTPQQEGKTFTQDQLNAIVGKRLLEERQKSEVELVKREQDLQRRELMISAKESLAEKGLPGELLEALNCSSDEALAKSLEIMETVINNIKTSPPAFIGMTPAEGHTPEQSSADGIRKAMGLT